MSNRITATEAMNTDPVLIFLTKQRHNLIDLSLMMTPRHAEPLVDNSCSVAVIETLMAMRFEQLRELERPDNTDELMEKLKHEQRVTGFTVGLNENRFRQRITEGV